MSDDDMKDVVHDPDVGHDSGVYPEQSGGYFSFANLKIAQVNLITGLYYGYNIGFVGVWTTLMDIGETCSSFTSSKSCETLSYVKCSWVTGEDGSSHCGWTGKTACKQTYFDEESCSGNHDCVWNYQDASCDNGHGYSALESGLYAGAMTLGGLIGAFLATWFCNLLGPKRTFLVLGAGSVVCSVLYHICAAWNVYWLLVITRVVVGVVVGIMSVAGPLYTVRNAAKAYQRSLGVLFQIALNLGITLAGVVGLALGLSIHYGGDDQILMGRLQILSAVCTFFALCVLLLGFVLSPHATYIDGEDAVEQIDQNEFGWVEMARPLFLGVVISGTLQMTGINAISNYAPMMMKALHLDPFVGNLMCQALGFVTSTLAIPLVSYIPLRVMFLVGSFFTSIACLFLCGLPVYPGVASNNVSDGVGIFGYIVFLIAFAIGVAPPFYVLSQELFPVSFRPKGASFTMVVQSIFTLIINALYPTAVQNLSGGPSGNQKKGQALAAMFFGVCGIICFVLQIFFLQSWEDSHPSSSSAEPVANEPNREDNARESAAVRSEGEDQ